MTTVTLTADLKSRVAAHIQQCRDKIEAHFGVSLPMPEILYTLKGTTAGWANGKKWQVNFNAYLLVHNEQDYFDETIAHEFCHLAVEKIYPEAHRRTYGQKRRPHGHEWKSIMRISGHEPSRTHNYDTSAVRSKKASYTYVCQNCGKSYDLGPKRHAKLQVRARAYWCRRPCGGTLVLKGSKPPVKATAKVIMEGTRKVVKKKTVAVPTQTQTFSVNHSHQFNSKFEHCYSIYTATKTTLSRKEIIQLFINMVGMTEAGASSYYQRCKQ